MKVKVTISVNEKGIKLPTGARLLIRRACIATLKYENFENDAEIDVTIVGDRKIKEINNEFRNIDKATDVLSFPLGEDGVYDKNPVTDACMLGDIVISAERARHQADLYGHSLRREIAFLTVHSMLHLLGYDHMTDEEAKEMFGLQEEILKEMGITR